MRRRAVLAGMGLASLGAAGCSNGGGGGGAGGDVDISDTEMEATIEFAAWESDFDWKSVLEGFTAKYPNITVETTKSPFKDFFTRLQTQASGDNLPDAFMMNGPSFQLYASHDKLISLESVVDAGELDFSNYPEAMEELYTYEDVPYGVPTSYDSIGLWYNEELFEKAGVEVPTVEWTWENLHEAAKSISEALEGEGVYGFAGGAYNQELFYNLIFQAGGAVLNEDATQAEYSSPGSRQALQFLRDMVEDGSSPSIRTTADTSPDELFKSGKAAMVYGGSFRVAGYVDSAVGDVIQVVPLPKGEQRGVVLHGGAVVAHADSDNREAAAAFAVYTGSQEAQEIIGGSGASIPAFQGTEKAYIEAHPDYDLEIFPESAEEYGFPYPVSANTQAWLEVESDMIPKILAGELSVDEGTAQLDEKIDALLAEEAEQ
ncbi:ABC transporter substrate-binding protein [Brachybacterium sacelli]|uniref:Multiple sugar transport system substrate-binding protein n=2 Tax=Brachybacterium sacelli TaxID=173364 RepID=A0ABS4WYV7_9MICO|nr:sugar ABC transporter substrate-binding protein [Brachybacterium sacelli]MBP2381394.1 multiple sugar transport system substrate-binding protein [Brachybacterium sacelli]